jgi:uncharacterized protein YkwD
LVRDGQVARVDLVLKSRKPVADGDAEKELFTLVNDERTSRGLLPLVWDSQIATVSRAHSTDMIERRYFSHTSPNGEGPSARLKENGVPFTVAAENVALASSSLVAHQMLMSSESHRKNILSPDFTRIGIGVVDGGGRKAFTECFAG